MRLSFQVRARDHRPSPGAPPHNPFPKHSWMVRNATPTYRGFDDFYGYYLACNAGEVHRTHNTANIYY